MYSSSLRFYLVHRTLSTLFSNTLCPFSSLNVRDQVSHKNGCWKEAEIMSSERNVLYRACSLLKCILLCYCLKDIHRAACWSASCSVTAWRTFTGQPAELRPALLLPEGHSQRSLLICILLCYCLKDIHRAACWSASCSVTVWRTFTGQPAELHPALLLPEGHSQEEIWGLHSIVDDDCNLLGCYAMVLIGN
jgi:branched-subunit amino acid transport protein AzlD